MLMHPALAGALRIWRDSTRGEEFLFPELRLLYRADSPAVSRRIGEHFRACGIETTEPAVAGKRRRAISRAGFHSLRHSVATIARERGVALADVQDLLGHGSSVTTRIYAHGSPGAGRAAAAMPYLLTSKKEA
jgi:integrase